MNGHVLSCWDVRLPHQQLVVNPCANAFRALLPVLVQKWVISQDPVLARSVLDQPSVLQRADNVVHLNPSLVAQRLDQHLLVAVRSHRNDVFRNRIEPVASVAEQAKVGQRSLRRPRFALTACEQVAELDQELAKAHALLVRECKQARKVVVVVRLLLFRKVPNQLPAIFVPLYHDVEKERLHVVKQRLGFQKAFGKDAQVLAVRLPMPAVNLEEGQVFVAVNLSARRVSPRAGGTVPSNLRGALVHLQAILADVDRRQMGLPFRVARQHWSWVPAFQQMLAELELLLWLFFQRVYREQFYFFRSHCQQLLFVVRQLVPAKVADTYWTTSLLVRHPYRLAIVAPNFAAGNFIQLWVRTFQVQPIVANVAEQNVCRIANSAALVAKLAISTPPVFPAGDDLFQFWRQVQTLCVRQVIARSAVSLGVEQVHGFVTDRAFLRFNV